MMFFNEDEELDLADEESPEEESTDEILDTIYALSHMRSAEGEDDSAYCFAHEVADIFALTEDEIIDIAKENGYRIYEVIASDDFEGGYIIANEDCSTDRVKSDYMKFYEVDADVRDVTDNFSQKTESMNEDIEKHNELNPKLFDDNRLLPDVKDTIMNIAEEFMTQLEEDDIIIVPKDIVILGSNCSYNYNKDSDLDIHIIADETADCDKKHIDKIYNAYKSIFNSKFDLTIKGIEAEIYVELGECNAKSNGIYSVMHDSWIKEPSIEKIPDIDKDALDKMFKEWEDRYNELVSRCEQGCK